MLQRQPACFTAGRFCPVGYSLSEFAFETGAKIIR